VTTVNALPLATYAAGTYNVGPVSLADNVTRIQFDVARCTTADPTIWPVVTDTVEFSFQFSTNGGGSWQQWFDGSSGGGIASNPKTGELATMQVAGELPAGTNRQAKGQVTVTSATGIRTKVDVTVT